MGNGALAIGPKLPRPSSTLPKSPNRVLGGAGPLCPGTSDINFLGDLEGVVDLYTEVADCAFKLDSKVRGCDLVALRVDCHSMVTKSKRQCRNVPSRSGEFHPELLTEPYTSLSTYTARATARRLPPSIARRSPPGEPIAPTQRR